MVPQAVVEVEEEAVVEVAAVDEDEGEDEAGDEAEAVVVVEDGIATMISPTTSNTNFRWRRYVSSFFLHPHLFIRPIPFSLATCDGSVQAIGANTQSNTKEGIEKYLENRRKRFPSKKVVERKVSPRVTSNLNSQESYGNPRYVARLSERQGES